MTDRAPASGYGTGRAPLDYGVTEEDVSAAAVEARTGVKLPAHYHEVSHDRQAWGRGVAKSVRRHQDKPLKKARRKALKAKRGNISKAKRERIYARDGWKCLKCGLGTVSYLSLDHIVPLANGGSNADDNLQTLCKTCNCAKGRKTTAYYRADSPPS